MMLRGLRWQHFVVLLACLGLTGSLLVAPAGARKKHHKKSACQKLRGHDFARTKSLKLVAKRRDSVETDLVGCQLPRGDVRIFAIRLAGDTTTSDFKVHSVRGRWALVSAHSDSQYASESRVWVFDIAKGRVLYRISRWRCEVSQDDCAPKPSPVAKGLVDRIGKAALAFDNGVTTTIAGYGTNGKHKTFDSGTSADLPASSLKIFNNVASWMHSGEQRHGQLP
jgi:hypothetical protein